MVHYGPDGLYWGHGKKSFDHEHSGAKSCWNWEVQTMLSRKCTSEVNDFIRSNKSETAEDAMMRCFVVNASESHNVCTRQLKQFEAGKSAWDSVSQCARKEFGLAMRNLVQTSTAVGECRPIP